MKTVIITGGSRGIGAAAVRAFCARGDRVAFLYEKEDEKAQAVAAEGSVAGAKRLFYLFGGDIVLLCDLSAALQGRDRFLVAQITV